MKNINIIETVAVKLCEIAEELQKQSEQNDGRYYEKIKGYCINVNIKSIPVMEDKEQIIKIETQYDKTGIAFVDITNIKKSDIN